LSYHPENILLFRVTVTLTFYLRINRGHLRIMINATMKFHDPRHKTFLSYHTETILLFPVTVTLTFDLVTWKSIGFICESWSMYLSSFMIIGISVLELSSGKHFTISGHRDLDLWPSDFKISRGHLRVMINVPLKCHDPRPKRSWVIIQKPSGGRTYGWRTDRHVQNNKHPLLRRGAYI
jgi:hypothetical protein